MLKFLLMGFDGLDVRAFQVFGGRPRMPLRSHVPYTGPAWTTLYTGLPARIHGVLDPWGRGTESSASSKEYADKCIWAKLPPDVKVGLWGMPVSHPPTNHALSFYVAGFPFDDAMKAATTLDLPEGYWDERWWIEEPNLDESIFEIIGRLREERMQMAHMFAGACLETNVDFGAVGFRFPDRICHIFGHRNWEYEPAEKWSVKLAADIIGYLLETLQPDAWLMVSDHGMYKVQHRDLGVISMGGELEHLLRSRRWWNTMDPPQIIADYFGVELDLPFKEMVEEAQMLSLHQRFMGFGQGAAIEKVMSSQGNLRLNLGCGERQMEGDEWLNMDVVPYPGVDLVHNLNNGLPFPDESVAEIVALDILEHLSYHVSGIVLGEWCRVLRPGGVITIRVPDLEASARDYVSGKLTQLGFVQHMYGLTASLDWDTHYNCFDFAWFKGQLTFWGCEDIEKLPDQSPWSLTLRAVKKETPEPKDTTFTLEERQFVEKHLEGWGYA